ncbi:hypothetical protein PHRODO_240 [Bacillus phage Phrodo]|uniref:hypothetical protein n=1 Tax=Bacillus phage Phrodo TaxID=1805953 RepID=UPI0007A7692C|nr:hypothetical protein BI003_gp240 [Bacillus phage Phrodo]AMW62281.1 hypothetical protein PHRODO_240 [Bacillus phage Phrodo]UGO49050.1 hypothetical protein JARJAR_236 [Bacillus phage vB_BanH_JarJar]UGO50540.1 hypothetical protein RONSWANSON_234 [Bacillus phage vB_BanH_RonSwanson]
MEIITYVGLIKNEDYSKHTKYIGADFERAKDVVLAAKKYSNQEAIVELWVGEAVIHSFRYNTYHKQWTEWSNLEKESLKKASELVEELTDRLGSLGIVSGAISGLEDHESISSLLGSLNNLREVCLDLSVKANGKAAERANEADGGFYIGKD